MLLLLGLLATFGGRPAVEAQQAAGPIQPQAAIQEGAGWLTEGDFLARPMTGPGSGTAYTFIVNAVNGTGEGPASTQINSAALADNPTLALVKTVINDNGGESSVSDFTLRIDGNPVTNGAANELTVGDHRATEDGPLPGYAASVWGGDCAADGSITLALGDVKTCTITNDDVAPALTVIKTVINDNGGTAEAGSWAMDVAGESVSGTGFPGAEAPGVTVTLRPGTYSVNESGGPPGYTKTFSADCAGIIALGESRTCVITDDDIPPALTVIKSVVNDNGGDAVAGDWTLDITGRNVSSTGFAGAEAGVTVSINAGTYIVDVGGGPSGYARSFSADCSGAIGLGDALTCTITSDDISPKLAVISAVVNDHGGSAVAGDWNIDISGANVSNTSFAGAENPGVTVTLDAGAYSVGESAGPSGYAMSFSADCSGAVSLGDRLTCTITNDDIAPNVPTLTVTKTVVNDDGGSAVASDFTMEISGANVSSTGFPGSESGVTITLDAGAYSVSESGGPSGYAVTLSAGCSGSIGLGDNLTCTITNNDITPNVPTLTVTNKVINDNGGSAVAGDWNMNISGGNVSSTGFAGAENGVTITLEAGAYSISESSGPSGYAVTRSADCSGAIGLGDHLTCTIVSDDIAPRLTVINRVVNGGGGSAVASDWIMDIAGDNVSSTGFDGAEDPGVTITIDAGPYIVDVGGGPSGYASYRSADCSGAIGLGDILTCTITNDDITAQLTVINTVVNDGGGSAAASDWKIAIAGANVSSAGFEGVEKPGINVTLDPGVYNVSAGGGPSGYAVTLSSDCSGAIGLGDDLTCTIIHDDINPHLTVTVKVVNDNGSASASDWTMDITGVNVSNPVFLGMETGVTVTLDPGVYNVGERGGPSGYAMSFSANCSRAIRLGQHLACTITNDDITPNVPTLTVIKKVINDDGGSALVSDWTMDITGGNVFSTGFAGSESGVTITLDSGPYSVSANGGPSGYLMTLSDGCSGAISLGDVLTCTITNNDEPAVFVPVTNALPTATITSPVEGSALTADSTIKFIGSGEDPEDGILNGDSLRWTSSIVGEIGTGQSFTGSLGAGSHTITLTATDSQGASASISFGLTIDIPAAPDGEGDGGGGGGGGGSVTPAPTSIPAPQPTVIAEPTATAVPPTPRPTATSQPPADTPAPAPTITPQPAATTVPTQVAPSGATPVPAVTTSSPDSTDEGGLSIGALAGIGLGVIAVLAGLIAFSMRRTDRRSASARSSAVWGRYRWGREPR